MLGGNIVALTQLHWPTVHPALQEERKVMAKFPGLPGDLKWGKFDYPVTRSQKNTLDGLHYMMSGLPKHSRTDDVPIGYFCSQRPHSGDVIIGLNHESVTVNRQGRIKSNEETTFSVRRG
jgi:hypothetical protein